MPNPWGRLNAPMMQPTKDELRRRLSEARAERDKARVELAAEQEKGKALKITLDIALRKVGAMVVESELQRQMALPPLEPQFRRRLLSTSH